jgi:hypothetical protein
LKKEKADIKARTVGKSVFVEIVPFSTDGLEDRIECNAIYLCTKSLGMNLPGSLCIMGA